MLSSLDDDVSCPVTLMPHAMLASLQGQLSAELLISLRNNLLESAARLHKAKAIIDITGVTTLSRQDYLSLVETAQMLRLMGVNLILVGMRPGIIAGLSILGLDLTQIAGDCDLERALEQ